MNIKVSSNHQVAVDQNYFWQPMKSCPTGAKVQLLNLGGVAIYGKVTHKELNHYLGWAPLPKRPPGMESGRIE